MLSVQLANLNRVCEFNSSVSTLTFRFGRVVW